MKIGKRLLAAAVMVAMCVSMSRILPATVKLEKQQLKQQQEQQRFQKNL